MRRAWLCGQDQLTGRSFDHRKQWLQDRLELLAGCFAIDVLAFAVMSNHLHVILRNRPEIAAAWSDREIVRRWWMLFPGRRNDDGRPAELTEADLQTLCARDGYVAERRCRLSSISWLMRCLSEPIARQANREDDVTGRFWQGRFRCQPLLDEASILACAVYVDLNPIKARLADTPETARFTSLYERIQAKRQSGGKQSPRRRTKQRNATSNKPRAAWLSPVALEATRKPRKDTGRYRASDRGFLHMPDEDYRQLVMWAARELHRSSQTPTVSKPVRRLLENRNLTAEAFMRWVTGFQELTRRAAGDAASLAREAARCGRRWLQRSQANRQLFG